ncbi:hypothetical protein ACFPH6_13630 [Streptomyces xiangluensis]|uniref:Peptidase inhibitor family I36 n=1 Tax=Streptomyces xiangluensis TaxID=2665720 RepID=A0ABV8YP16_9ACTN
MRLRRLATATLATAALTAGLTATAAGPASADRDLRKAESGSSAAARTAGQEGEQKIQARYTVWATNVNVRWNYPNLACNDYPSTTNCQLIVGKVSAGQYFNVGCQKPGQPVGGNPNWVFITTSSFSGFMASYYIEYPDNVLPDVRWC